MKDQTAETLYHAIPKAPQKSQLSERSFDSVWSAVIRRTITFALPVACVGDGGAATEALPQTASLGSNQAVVCSGIRREISSTFLSRPACQRSQSIWSPSQNSADIPTTRASRSAVSGLMARLPRMSSLKRLLFNSSALYIGTAQPDAACGHTPAFYEVARVKLLVDFYLIVSISAPQSVCLAARF